jgi:hypothetical protein
LPLGSSIPSEKTRECFPPAVLENHAGEQFPQIFKNTTILLSKEEIASARYIISGMNSVFSGKKLQNFSPFFLVFGNRLPYNR